MKNYNKYNLTKSFLIKEYIDNKKSTNVIAKEITCSQGIIIWYLKKFNIPRRTYSEANKGKNHHFYGKKRPDHSKKMMGKNNPSFKHGDTLKKHYCIEPNCNNEICYENWLKGEKRCRSCSKKGELSLKFKGDKALYRQKHYCKKRGCNNEISYSNWKVGKRRCKSCARKEQWKVKEYRDKSIKSSMLGRQLNPNKPEKLLNNLLNTIIPNEYKFVGDGYIFIAGFCPDFINVNGQKKIIELFGCYWHKCPICGFGNKRPLDAGRRKTYKKYGYNTLVIWEHELKDLENVVARIMEFNLKGNGCN